MNIDKTTGAVSASQLKEGETTLSSHKGRVYLYTKYNNEVVKTELSRTSKEYEINKPLQLGESGGVQAESVKMDIDGVHGPGFDLDSSGVNAYSGDIANFSITNTNIETDSGAFKLNSSNPSIQLGSSVDGVDTGTGIWQGKDPVDSTYKFRVGDPTAQYMKWTGTELEINGTILSSSNAEITGTTNSSFEVNDDGSSTTAALNLNYNGTISSINYDGSAINIPDNNVNIPNDLNVGNIYASGEKVQMDTTVTASDNLLSVNFGEANAGVTNDYSGIEVDRGSLSPFRFAFEENSTDLFKVGEYYHTLNYSNLSGSFEFNEEVIGNSSGASGFIVSDDGSNLVLKTVEGIFSTSESITGQSSGATADVDSVSITNDMQAVATREDSPTDYGIPYWDNGNNRFSTNSNLTTDSSGNIIQTSGNYIMTDQVRAIDSDGLKLTNDDGNGIYIDDGGYTYIGDNQSFDVPLAINKASNEGNPNAGVALSFSGKDYSEYGYRFRANGDNFYQVLYNGSAINWKFYNGSYVSRLTLTNAGNVGINEPNPSYTVDINGKIGRNYTSGILGSGWIIDPSATGGSFAEFDNMRIRNEFRTHIFKKDIVRASNAIRVATDSVQIAENKTLSDSTSGQTLKVDNSLGNATFDPATFDGPLLVWIKSISDDGATISGVKFEVTNYSSGTDYDTLTVDTTGGSGGEIKDGDVAVRVSGGYMMEDASSQYSPFYDVYDNVASWSDFQSEGKLKLRMGNLEGIGDTINGESVTGYGLYSDNAYLKGGIVATYGKIAAFNMNSDVLTYGEPDSQLVIGNNISSYRVTDGSVQIGRFFDDNQYIGMWVTSSDNSWGTFRKNSNNKVEMYITSDYDNTQIDIGNLSQTQGNDDFGMYVTSNGNKVFRVSNNTAELAGWDFDNSKIYKTNITIDSANQLFKVDDGTNTRVQMGEIDSSNGYYGIEGLDGSGNTIFELSNNNNLVQSKNWVSSTDGAKLDLDSGIYQVANSGTYMFEAGDLAQGQIQSHTSKSVGYGVIAQDGSGNVVFQLDDNNQKIAGFDFDEDKFSSSSGGLVLNGNSNAIYTSNSNGSTRLSSGVLELTESDQNNSIQYVPYSTSSVYGAAVQLIDNDGGINGGELIIPMYKVIHSSDSTYPFDYGVAMENDIDLNGYNLYGVDNLQVDSFSNNNYSKITTSSKIVPASNGYVDLGASSYHFNTVYTDNVVGTSDRRKKENIKDTELGLNFINNLKPKDYKWKHKDTRIEHTGLVAQDVIKTLEDIGINPDKAGIVDNSDRENLGLRYTEFIPILVNAIKEQQAEIEKLKSQ